MDKNYEERFQQLVEQYHHEEQLYKTMRENCNERIAEIDRKILKLKAQREKIEKEKSELKYPHYVDCLLPQVMELLNEAVADRGYQFETEGFTVFGLSCETPVHQDYSRSEKKTAAYFTFRPGEQGKFLLKKKSGEYQCSMSIPALNDFNAEMQPVESFQALLDHIDECERKDPPKQWTEDELIETMQDGLWKFRCSPQPLWTYRTITAAMQVSIEKGYHIEEGERIPADMVDKEMFELGLRAGVYFYHFLPKEKLEELGAYEEEFLIEQIRRNCTSLCDVPEEKITRGVLKGIIPGSGYWTCEKCIKNYPHLIDQEIADLVVKERLSLIEFIPDEFKTFEMCQKVYKECKPCRKFIPSRYLTETGRMKKKPC